MREKSKNVNKKRKTENLARVQTDGHTDTQTDAKVNTEDTLSGFQEFFLQPIIKDRSNTTVCHH